MSVDKLVDSTQLDSDLTSVADAIRAKSGGSSQLAFPAGFVSEIGNIPSGTPARTKWYRPPDWPDITSLTFPANHGGYYTIDANLLTNRTFAVHNTSSGSYRVCKIGHIENGAFVVDTDYSNPDIAEITIPANLGRYPIMYLQGGVSGGGGNAPLVIQPPYVPIVEAYLKNNGSYWPFDPLTLVSLYNLKAITITGIITLSNNPRYWPLTIEHIRIAGDIRLEVGFRNLFLNEYCLVDTDIEPTNTIVLSSTGNNNYPKEMYRNCYAIKRIDLSFCSAEYLSDLATTFDGCYSLEDLDLSGWDMSGCVTSASCQYLFRNCKSLKNLTLNNAILPTYSISFAQSSLLANSSLVHIANALPIGSYTLTLHAMPKAACSTIMGVVADGVFTEDASGTVTLADFITTVKGWTLA